MLIFIKRENEHEYSHVNVGLMMCLPLISLRPDLLHVHLYTYDMKNTLEELTFGLCF